MSQVFETGGTQTVALSNAQVIAGAVVKGVSGRLVTVLVTTLIGANAVVFFDNAAAASGTIIGIVPNAAAVGAIFTFNMPAVNGIFAQAAAGGGAVTISIT